jgi:CBS domain-containing protein
MASMSNDEFGDENEVDMKTKDLMTPKPACCTPETSLQQVAAMMVEHDCGCIPVVESQASLKPVGVVTDRDICLRTVAQGRNPLTLTAGDSMSSPVVTATPETSVKECCQMMEDNQIRRIVVVDETGGCCGIIAQADVARHATKQQTAEVVREVSQRNEEQSRVGVPR